MEFQIIKIVLPNWIKKSIAKPHKLLKIICEKWILFFDWNLTKLLKIYVGNIIGLKKESGHKNSKFHFENLKNKKKKKIF